MADVLGIHHVTAIAGDPRENLAFYTGLLGMRLVKRSVNQDDPGTYHLFYADAEGSPGTDLTFFPWPHLPAGRLGTGITGEVMLAVPVGSLEYWGDRLIAAGVHADEPAERFGERALPVTDPHGMAVVLVETDAARQSMPWEASPVPAGMQVRGIHGVRLWEQALDPTRELLEGVLGFSLVASVGEWHRFVASGSTSGAIVDVREAPGTARGVMGRGSVHHVAFRVPDDAAHGRARARVLAAGHRPTPVIDRFWFKSVYFSEPGGVLFELATDGPGFAVDEDPAHLGEHLVLPPWLEADRPRIEAMLPPLG